jgi:hypothetical protein
MTDELSEEQRQRILDEERNRHAEEQFRTQVRMDLQKNSTATGKPPQPKSNRSIFIVFGIAVALLVVVLVVVLTHSKSSQPQATTSTAAVNQSPVHNDRASPLPPALPPPPQKLTTAQIAAKATPSVVVIENFNESGEKAGQGSGYIFSGDGIIITNYHVIRGAKSLNIRLPGQEPYRVDSVLGYQIDHDVAALQVSGGSLPALTTDTLDEPKVGDKVVAIGAPLGLESTVSEGIVSAVRDAGTIHIIQTTASISPGSSGGPLLNDYGKVIGLTTATVHDGQSLNFVVSAKHISELLSRRQPIALSEMLDQTKVSDRIGSSTIMVPARNAVQLTFVVNGQQGATLEGTYSIAGGSGNDVGVMLLGTNNAVIVNSGRVTRSGEFRLRLPRGRYTLLFDNRFSNFSAKSVTPDLTVTYYK